MGKIYKFWLVEGDRMPRHWLKVIEGNSIDDLEDCTEKFTNALVNKAIFSKRETGLDRQMINSLTWRYINQLDDQMRSGEVILFNQNGGYCFYTPDMKIIEEKFEEYFPYDENNNISINGWLSPIGTFIRCAYCEHIETAFKIVGGTQPLIALRAINDNMNIDDFLLNNGYVKIQYNDSTYSDHESALYFPVNFETKEKIMITKHQIKWFEEHSEYLTSKQKEELLKEQYIEIQ